MTPEQRTNAETLLEFIKTLEPKQCDMTAWAKRPKSKGLIPPPEQRGQHGCGTAACLAGWAALKLAPTADSGDASGLFINSKMERRIDKLSVDAEWVRAHGLGYSMLWQHCGMLSFDQIGTQLLGTGISKWFSEQDGPDRCDMTDKDWMIAVLQKELGLDYDETIDQHRYGFEGPPDDRDD